MPLQKFELPFNFTIGLDTKNDPKICPHFDALENIRFEGLGTIKKRPGLLSIPKTTSTGGTITSGKALIPYGDDKLMIDGSGSAYAYSTNLAKWVSRGSLPMACGSIKPIKNFTSASSIYTTSTKVGNYFVIVSVVVGGSYYGIVTDSLGNFISPETKLTTGEAPNDASILNKVVTMGTKAVLIYVYLKSVKYVIYDSVTNSWGSPGTIITEATTNDIREMACCDNSTGITIFYKAGTSPPTDPEKVSIIKVNTSMTITGTYSPAPSSGVFNPCYEYCNTSMLYDYVNNRHIIMTRSKVTTTRRDGIIVLEDASFTPGATGTSWQQLNSFTATKALGIPGQSSVSGMVINGSTLVIFSSVPSVDAIGVYSWATSLKNYIYKITMPTWGTITTTSMERGPVLYSSPFVYSGKAYAVFEIGTIGQQCCYTVSEDGVAVGKHQYLKAPYAQPGYGGAWEPMQVTLGSAGYEYIANIMNNGNIPILAKVTVAFSAPYIGRNANFSGLAVICGGYLCAYDGSAISELGFHHYPTISAMPYTTGGSFAAGSYDYVALYVWNDTNGRTHYSSPSTIVNVTTTGSTSAVYITVNSYVFTSKPGNVYIQIYRSVAGQNVFKMLNAYPVNQSYADRCSTGAQEIVDTGSTVYPVSLLDTLIYTTGGILENTSMPPASSVYQCADRLFIVNAEEPDTINYTKKQNNIYGPCFNDFFSFKLLNKNASTNTNIGAISYMDGRILFFKEDAIYYMTGDGPNELGSGTFSDPILIASDSGCLEQKSIIQSQDGVFFKSRKGFSILTRGMQVIVWAPELEEYKNTTISGGVLIPDTFEIRYTTTESDLLCYDYYFKKWSTFKNYSCVDSVMMSGAYVHLKSDGTVKVEQPTFQDDGSPIPIRIVTSWIHPKNAMTGAKDGEFDKNIQEYNRVYRLSVVGEFKSAHTVTINVYYDYEKYISETYTITPLSDASYNITVKPATLTDGTNDGVYQYKVHLQRQKCQAIQFEIIDVPNVSVPGESFKLTNMSLTVGAKTGLNKTSSNKQA